VSDPTLPSDGRETFAARFLSAEGRLGRRGFLVSALVLLAVAVVYDAVSAGPLQWINLSEHLPEGGAKGLVGILHGAGQAEVGQAGHSVLGLAAGDDPREVRQVRLHVQRDSVEGDPPAHLDADGGDLVLPGRGAGAAALDPDADPAFAHRAVHGQAGQGGEDPGLQGGDEGADVLPPGRQVQHHIGHPLAGPVIGELAAAAGAEDREPVGVEEVGVPRRDASGIEGWMLQQPDQLPGLAPGDRPGPGLHGRHRLGVVDLARRDRPAAGRAIHAPEDWRCVGRI